MTLPTLFISHGSPMYALGFEPAAGGWRALARALPRPRAVLVATAHWETGEPTVGAAPLPETIHDFGGFPQALFRLQYPAPGAPEVAQRAAELLAGAGLPARVDAGRGLDHGTWVPLLQMYPQADVPVLQVSIQSHLGAQHELAVGAALAPLAGEGVLIIGSGAITHNLREWIVFAQGRGLEPSIQPAATYVDEFCASIDSALRRGDSDFLAHWRQRAPHAARAHPSDEHFLPLLVAYGAAGPGAAVERIDLGVDSAVLAMDAYRFSPAARPH
jgi:4,5-DOPA dioxygenase extradiol